MSPGRIIAAIFGVVFAPAAIGLIVGGLAIIVAIVAGRDDDGFFRSPAYQLTTADYALTSDEISLAPHPGDWWPSGLVDVRFEVESPSGQAAFFGIGPAEAVDTYLSGVARSRVTGLGLTDEDVTYRTIGGGAPISSPADQTFWVLAATTSDRQTLTWEVAEGDWGIVIMNADGSAGVTVNTVFAVRIPVLIWIGLGMVLGGLLFGAIAAALLVVAFNRRGAEAMPLEPTAPGAFSAAGTTIYPVVVEGHIDAPLSRWMWLVKWFLAIPHFVILAFLGIAFFILTVIAFFAILFTGRYPRQIFEFNVGVMRWAWRVVFYCTGVLATDRYPPFTLAATDYPARLEVAYPERLSQGLVLVKWWLLAIPHYIIVGFFTSGLIWWTTDIWGADTVLEIGGGLIGILALIAAIILLFTARYPQPLFDLLMGLNRWVFRVAAYASLMRDEYPPFRLDLGGREPSASTPVQPDASERDSV